MDLNKYVSLLANYCQKRPHSGKHAEKIFSLYTMHINYLVDKERFFATILFLYTKANNSVCIYRYCFPVKQFYVTTVCKIQKNNCSILVGHNIMLWLKQILTLQVKTKYTILWAFFCFLLLYFCFSVLPQIDSALLDLLLYQDLS